MSTSLIYLTVVIAVIAIIAILRFVIHKHQKKNEFTPLAGLAFGFILAGFFTGDDRLIGYSLLGIGVILAIIDIYHKKHQKEPADGN
ncbi:MAG: hypothetical protein WCX28_12585 [Bacteriovoracaceae bacterium]